jgi:hypothetical protein
LDHLAEAQAHCVSGSEQERDIIAQRLHIRRTRGDTPNLLVLDYERLLSTCVENDLEYCNIVRQFLVVAADAQMYDSVKTILPNTAQALARIVASNERPLKHAGGLELLSNVFRVIIEFCLSASAGSLESDINAGWIIEAQRWLRRMKSAYHDAWIASQRAKKTHPSLMCDLQNLFTQLQSSRAEINYLRHLLGSNQTHQSSKPETIIPALQVSLKRLLNNHDEILERIVATTREISAALGSSWKTEIGRVFDYEPEPPAIEQGGNTSVVEMALLRIDEMVCFISQPGMCFPQVRRIPMDSVLLVKSLQWMSESFSSPATENNGHRAITDLLDLLGPMTHPWFNILVDAKSEAVAIAPDGMLSFFPWHIVPCGPGTKLIDQMQVTYQLSLTTISPFSRNNDAPKSALIMTNPSLDLPMSALEGEYVKDALEQAGVTTTHLSKENATTSHFLKQASKSEIVHLACHAHFDGSDLTESWIQFADRKMLLPELAASVTMADGAICFLSCCTSARPVNWLTVGVMSLAAVFLHLGARAIVAATMPVPDDLMAIFADHYYRSLATNGWSPARAYRWTMQKIEREYGNNFQLAGLILLGS